MYTVWCHMEKDWVAVTAERFIVPSLRITFSKFSNVQIHLTHSTYNERVYEVTHDTGRETVRFNLYQVHTSPTHL